MAYVHIPFCENHCLFCGFYQNPWRPEAGPAYVDLVLKQARSFAGRKVLEGPPLRALYFGGGTPTALAAKDIARLVSGLRDVLPLAPDCEITLEGRVFSFTEDKMEAAFNAGVNRISLGVQTFDTKIRRALGRKRSKEDVIRTLETLVAMDSGAIVIDLMYGLPKQTMESWHEDLLIVDQIGLDGVDHYGLSLIPGTPLMLSIEKGKLAAISRKELGRFFCEGCGRYAGIGGGSRFPPCTGATKAIGNARSIILELRPVGTSSRWGLEQAASLMAWGCSTRLPWKCIASKWKAEPCR